MKRKMLIIEGIKVAIAFLLIMILTFSNFITAIGGFISYASDQRTETNSENINFDVYLIDEDNNKNYVYGANINNKELKMGIEVSVNQTGYFDGKITLTNGNIEIKNIIENDKDKVNKLENNTITLNRINAGETAKIILQAEIKHQEKIPENYTEFENTFELKGEYKYEENKVTDIQSTKSIQLNLKYPEEQSEEILEAEIITNKIFNINQENKRLIQILLKSGIQENIYPIKQTQININVPENVENIEVMPQELNGTTKMSELEFTEENWNWDKEKNSLQINIQNTSKDGQIYWPQEGYDQFVITYIFPENIEYRNIEFNIQRIIELYNTQLTQIKNELTLKTEEEKDKTINYTISNTESQIYKGKIYSHQDREYQKTGTIDINYSKINKQIELIENEDKYILNNQQITANSIYKNIIFKKEQIEKILGETGELSILKENDEIISTINKDTQANENNEIEINLEELNITNLKIRINNEETNGKIEFISTKILKDSGLDRQVTKQIRQIYQ